MTRSSCCLRREARLTYPQRVQRCASSRGVMCIRPARVQQLPHATGQASTREHRSRTRRGVPNVCCARASQEVCVRVGAHMLHLHNMWHSVSSDLEIFRARILSCFCVVFAWIRRLCKSPHYASVISLGKNYSLTVSSILRKTSANPVRKIV